MADFPALPLWTDAYLADTGDLDVCEHGCYLLLLMLAWRRSDCALPNDMKWMRHALNAYCGGSMHGNRFNNYVPGLLRRFFTLGADGKWHQKRLEKEREFQLNLKRIQRENIQKRWAKGKGNNGLADTTVIPRLYPHTHTIEEGSSSSISETTGYIQNEPAKKYALEYGCVRLTEADLDRWRKAFPHVAVEGELMAKEPWLAKQGSWFNAAAGWLNKAEREAKKTNGTTEKPKRYDAYWQEI